jgi:adenylate cyclase
LLWTWAFSAVAVTWTIVRSHRRLEPVREWIKGRRDPKTSIKAWQTAVGLSLDAWPRVWYRQPLFIAVGAALGAVVVLDLDWTGALAVFAGAWVAIAYSAVLDYLSVESGMRPVVVDIARCLPADFDFGRAALPLRLKLLGALPLINVITGVVVAGLSSPGNEVADLGVDVLTASAVAFTGSLVLTLRLSNSVVAPIHDLVGAARAVERGQLDVSVPVTTSDEVGRLSQAFNTMVAGLAERERIRSALGTYLDPAVAEHVLKEGTAQEGEEVEVTVMFIDVRDFTGFAERSSAQEVVAALNRLFEQIVPIIHEHHGHIDKFVGDGLLAVFGAPRRQPRHAQEALAAACEIAERVKELDEPLRIGIGLNSGRVVAGNVGGSGRFDFSVIGDAVNVAARVEAATRQTGDTILIAEPTKQLLDREEVRLEPRQGVELKGKREPVALYAVVDSDLDSEISPQLG